MDEKLRQFPRTPRDRKVRILIADDFEAWRLKVRDILAERPDYQIISEACNGLEAVQKTLELRPDLVLLDMAMPRLNGIEAAKRIRKDSPGTTIIFVTQNTDPEIKNAALATGAYAYVLKSDSATTLIPAITAALDTRST